MWNLKGGRTQSGSRKEVRGAGRGHESSRGAHFPLEVKGARGWWLFGDTGMYLAFAEFRALSVPQKER